MNKVSKKQAAINRKKELIRLELLDEYGCCHNCGSPHNLTLSHLISTGQEKHLETEYENCVLDCLRCHTVWENMAWEIKLLHFNDFEYRILKMHEVYEIYFRKIFNLFMNQPVKKSVIKIFEKNNIKFEN